MRIILLLLCAFLLLSAAPGGDNGQEERLVTSRLIFPASGSSGSQNAPVSAAFTSDGSFKVSWRLSETSPERLSYQYEDNLFIYHTPEGRKAVSLSGNRHTLSGKQGFSASDNTATSSSGHALFVMENGRTFRSLDPQGNVRFIFSLTDTEFPMECQAAPNGDAVCISDAFGVVGIRAQTDVPRIWIDGKEHFFAQPPAIRGGSVYVPFRSLFEAMDASVQWDAKNRTVTAVRNRQTVRMTLGSKEAYVNKRKVRISQPPYVEQGRLMVPLRFASEAMNCLVIWEAATRTIQVATL